MNTKILVVAICLIVFSSCSNAYKLADTPDDVYYSPAQGISIVPIADKYDNTYDDGVLLMNIRDPRWRYFDYGYDYNYTPYSYGYNTDYYYNPYYCSYPVYSPVIYYSPVSYVNTTPRMTNLSAYKPSYNNSNQALRQDRVNAERQQKTYNYNSVQLINNEVYSRPAYTPSSSQNNSTVNYNNSSYNNYNNSNVAPVNNNTNNNYDNRNYAPSNNNSSSGSSGGISRPVRH